MPARGNGARSDTETDSNEATQAERGDDHTQPRSLRPRCFRQLCRPADRLPDGDHRRRRCLDRCHAGNHPGVCRSVPAPVPADPQAQEPRPQQEPGRRPVKGSRHVHRTVRGRRLLDRSAEAEQTGGVPRPASRDSGVLPSRANDLGRRPGRGTGLPAGRLARRPELGYLDQAELHPDQLGRVPPPPALP